MRTESTSCRGSPQTFVSQAKLQNVIPTTLLVGLVFGRWWRVTIPVGTLAWVVLLIATGAGSGISFALGAAAFGAANVIVGVLVYVVSIQRERYTTAEPRGRSGSTWIRA